jgi:uncharacterized membrane protein YdbT with pleckstrin-like domain
MGRYVESNLLNDEKIEHEGKTSIFAQLPMLILGTLLIPFGIGLICYAVVAIRYYTTELAITNKRVIAKFGLIRRDTVEMNISKIESLQVRQSILGRLLNFGDLIISGAGNPKAPIPGISDPINFRKRFFEIQEASGLGNS